MLARRKKLEAEEKELYRYPPHPLLLLLNPFSTCVARLIIGNSMYQSMQNAMEELRLLDPPGTKDAGRLYRVAMEKKGIFGYGGVPIEYARMQTDTPGPEPWNHGWTR